MATLRPRQEGKPSDSGIGTDDSPPARELSNRGDGKTSGQELRFRLGLRFNRLNEPYA